MYSTFYWGTAGYSLFILQKQPNGYKDISTLVFEPQEIVDIRSEKTNGYHDIKLTGSNGDNVVPSFCNENERKIYGKNTRRLLQ